MSEKNYTTSDLAFAAYLMLRGYKLITCDRTDAGKFNFVFEDPAGDASSLLVEYLSSDFCKFDTNLKNLKKMLYR